MSERSVLITGCSSGIGLTVARGLAQRGWRVFATARREQDVARLAEEGLESLPLDVTIPATLGSALKTVLERTGGTLDALFNNAGYGQPRAVEDLSREVLRAQFETNLFGAHELTCQVLPVMRRQGHGRIVQHSSILGFIALPYRGAYIASKFALEGLTDALRQELDGTGIHVSLIETGPVRSRFRENSLLMYRRHIDAERSAHKSTYAAVEKRLTSSDEGGFLTLGPEAVLKKVVHALESPRPKPRYHVTLPTHLFKFVKRFLSTNAMDLLLLASTRSERR